MRTTTSEIMRGVIGQADEDCANVRVCLTNGVTFDFDLSAREIGLDDEALVVDPDSTQTEARTYVFPLAQIATFVVNPENFHARG